VAKSVHNMRNMNFMRNDHSEKIKNGWNMTKEDLKSGGRECQQYQTMQIMNAEGQDMDMKKKCGRETTNILTRTSGIVWKQN